MSWNTATKYSDTQWKQKWVIPAKPSPHSNYTKKTIFISGTCIHKKLAANKEAWVPISRLKEKDTTKYFKYKINQMFLKLNMQTREHGWLCKWNHKQAYQCLPIINKLSWVLLPQVEFWSKESMNRQTDGQPGPMTWRSGRSSSSNFYQCYFCIILNRAKFQLGWILPE